MNGSSGTGLRGSEVDDSSGAGLVHWHLCDSFSVVQAALLIAGHDPSRSFADIERWDYDVRPSGYEAAKRALVLELDRQAFFGPPFGSIVRVPTTDRKIDERSLPIDVEISTVRFNSVKSWLSEQGITTGFFFSKASARSKNQTPDYLDPDNARYAPKLAAAVRAWAAVEETAKSRRKSPKTILRDWLAEHAAEFQKQQPRSARRVG